MWILGKAFVYFVAWKALSTMMFREPLSILAVGLIVIVACTIEFFTYMQVAAHFGSGMARAAYVGDRTPSLKLLFARAYLISAAVTVVAGLIIAYAFSREFWRGAFGSGMWERHDDFFEQDLVLFVLMIAIPMAVNVALFSFAARSQSADA